MIRFPRVLVTLARARLGMSQAELAEAVGRNQALISKVENGVVAPDDELVASMSKALGVPRKFFDIEEQVYPPEFSFHRTRKISKKEQDRLWAEMNMIRFALAHLLRSMDIEATLPLPEYDIDAAGGASMVASSVRHAWRILPGPIRNLIELIESAGIIVISFDFKTNAMDGTSHLAAGSLPPVIFLNANLPGDRMRFSAAHELGHIIMHKFATPTMEDEANEFASAFLMPAEDIKGQLQNRLNLGIAGSLKQAWGCSMQSIFVRAHRLGTISESQYRRFMQMMAPYKYVEPYPVPQEPIRTFSELWDFHIKELSYSNDDLLNAMPIPRSIMSDPSLGVPIRPSLSIVR